MAQVLHFSKNDKYSKFWQKGEIGLFIVSNETTIKTIKQISLQLLQIPFCFRYNNTESFV